DGRLKTNDAAADGYVRAEGCAAVVLKRLSNAVADRDPIVAVIRGSAMNHGGASGGLTIPNGAAQQTAIREALAQARVQPHQIQYVETQGTGTPLGDAIEVRALGSVFKQERSPQQPLWLASVKTNIGHTETASGLASLIKVALALQHQQLPPHLHLQQVNPEISLADIPAKIPTTLVAWPQGQPRQLAGVNAFGMSGTNAHVLVEAAPTLDAIEQFFERPLHLLPLSAKTPAALQQMVQRYATYLATHADLDLGDVCFTASLGRSHFNHRLTFVGDTTAHLQSQLAGYLANDSIPRSTPVQEIPTIPPKVVFVLAGETTKGLAPIDAIRQLYGTQPIFRAAIDRCARILAEWGVELLDTLYPERGASTAMGQGRKGRLHPHSPIPPYLLFAIDYALIELFQSWGIQPDRVVATGIGRAVADCVSGEVSLVVALQTMASNQAQTTVPTPNGATVQDSTALANQDLVEEYVLRIHPHQATWKALLRELATIYQRGISVDWLGFDRPYGRRRLPLPTYPFQRQRYWNDLATRGAQETPSAPPSLPTPHASLSREALLGVDPAQRQQRLAADLCDRIAHALGVSPAILSPAVALNTLAFDSIMALELKFDLEKALGSPISITALLQNQSVADLATQILQDLSAEVEERFPQLTPAPEARHQPFPLNDIQEAYWIGRSGL
ncbi:MAG: ketoacyl-synthetase C-terminal extension domain-containing protein, partial [Cyanobacteria bacterium J06659_2]